MLAHSGRFIRDSLLSLRVLLTSLLPVALSLSNMLYY